MLIITFDKAGKTRVTPCLISQEWHYDSKMYLKSSQKQKSLTIRRWSIMERVKYP